VLGGAVLLTLCDTLARTLAAPAQLPTGAVTAVLGGPFFVIILLGQKRRAAMWGRGS
jgi:iron complex transport system permease protein